MSNKAAAGPQVLVVDPHDDTRDLYRAQFEMAGYRVFAAADTSEARTVAQRKRLDLIITELDFIRGLRNHATTQAVPIVVVTAHAQAPTLAAAIDAGATAAVPKPSDPEALLHLISTLLDQSRDRRSREDWRAGLKALLEDVPREKYVDRATRSRAEALLARIDDTRLAVLVANNEGRYVDANVGACELTGYRRTVLLTKSVWDVTPIPSQTSGRALWDEFISRGEYDGPYTVLRKDGALVAVHAVAAANVLPGIHVSGLALMPKAGWPLLACRPA